MTQELILKGIFLLVNQISQPLTKIDLQISCNYIKMIRFSQRCFKMSFYRNILVNDPTPFDILINDIPPNGLQKDVSAMLKIDYLSKYEGGQEQFSREKVKYQGKIIGDHSRLFFSIPSARENSQEYYYVHYLLNTGSPYTTLTHQALCCLFGKNFDDHNILFPPRLNILIAGKLVQTHLSNPNDKEQNPGHNYRNVNILGQSFMRRYKISQLEQNFETNTAVLELIK